MKNELVSTSTPELWQGIWEEGDPTDFWDWLKRESTGVRGTKIINYLKKRRGGVESLSTIEVGSGPGIYSFLFRSLKANTTLLDYSSQALALAKRFFDTAGLSANYVAGDALLLDPHLLEKFDVAMSFGTIEHYRYPERFLLAKAHVDLVKPGGMVAISVPNKNFFPHESLKWVLQHLGKWSLGYEGAFTRRELFKLGRRLCLEDIQVVGSGMLFDLRRYVKIVLNTRTLQLLMPKLLKTNRRDSPDTPCFLDDFWGADLVLLGYKPINPH